MPYYSYEVRDKQGRFKKANGFAENKEALVKMLQSDGAVILSLKENAATTMLKAVRKMHTRVTLDDLGLFANVMTVLLDNGIPLVETLEVVLKQVESIELARAIEQIKKDVEGGATFAQAVGKHQRIFGTYWRDMIEAGELSGQLPFVIKQILGFVVARNEMNKKVVSAFTYPTLLVVACIVAVLFFLIQVVPVFDSLFRSFNSKLPPLTQALIDLSSGLKRNAVAIAVSFVILIVALQRALSTRKGRLVFENILFKLPVLGDFAISVSIEKFVSTLSALLRSGIPIIKALDVAERTAQSVIFEDRIEEVKTKITGGITLSESLSQTGLFPPIAIQLILVAEKTGNYSNMLDEVDKYFKGKIETLIVRFLALLEPLILVFMTVIVGALLLALFMPLFSLTQLH